MAQHDGKSRDSFEPARTSDTTPPAATGGCKVGLRRTGHSVEITLTSSNEYASIELYDSLLQAVKNGSLRLEVKLATA